MRRNRTYGRSCGTGSFAIAAFCLLILASPLFADRLKGLKWETLPEEFRLLVKTEEQIRFVVADHVEKKGYFYLDILGIDQSYEDDALELKDPRISKILIQSHPKSRIVRLVFYPRSGVRWKVSPEKDLRTLVVQIIPLESSPSVRPSQPSAALKSGHHILRPSPPPEAISGENRGSTPNPSTPAGADSTNGGRKKIIIIDPGHGGFNRGGRTFHRINGRHWDEKDLVLQYALRLKHLIDQSPNLTALLTRDRDEYVSLADRVDFAQKHGGDLFISIHLNAAPNIRSASARGIEFFHWRESGTGKAAMSYLEKLENDQLLPDLTRTQDKELKTILTSMLRDALEEEKIRSSNVCNAMWEVFQKNPYFQKYHRKPPVKSARFVVLANYAMPAILIEVGFLTNDREAGNLISGSFQWTVARLMYNGIQEYFSGEDPNFKPHYVSY